MNSFSKFWISLATIALIGHFIFGVFFYSRTVERLEEDPLVTNLTKTKLVSYVKFGAIPECDHQVSTNPQCWVNDRLSPKGWLPLVLPKVDFLREKEFRGIRYDDPIYYRIPIQLTEAQKSYAGTISFSPMYVNHYHFRVYLNGTVVHESDGVFTGKMLNLAIPEEVKNQGTFVVGIESKYRPSDWGIFHYSSMYVGPKIQLDQVYLFEEWSSRTYFLLFAVAKGSLFLLFALMFVWQRRDDWQLQLRPFLIYAFCATAEDLVRGSLLGNIWLLSVKVAVFFTIRFIGLVFLCRFIQMFLLQRRPTRAYEWAERLGGVSVSVLLILHCIAQVKQINVPFLISSMNYISIILLGIVVYLHFQKSDLEAARSKASLIDLRISATFLVLYCSCVLIEETVPFIGFEKRALIDLALFYFFSYIYGRAFSATRLLNEEQAQELLRSEVARSIAKMTQMLAHDFRKPLVLWEQLQQKLKSLPDLQSKEKLLLQYENALSVSLFHAERLSNDLLNVDKPVHLNNDTFELAGSIRDAAVLGYAIVPFASSKILCRWPEELMIHGDRDALVRCFANLIANALEALDACGAADAALSIDVFHEGDENIMRLEFSNRSQKLPESFVPNMFKPFASHGKPLGTGLGLYIVKKIVSAHNGSASIYSHEDLTTVILKIPQPPQIFVENRRLQQTEEINWMIHSQNSLQQMEVLSSPGLAEQVTMALIDDDPFEHEQWQRRELPCKILHYHNPQAFLDAMRSPNRPQLNLVVTDYYFNGSPLCGSDIARFVNDHMQVSVYLNSDATPNVDEQHLFAGVFSKGHFENSVIDAMLKAS